MAFNTFSGPVLVGTARYGDVTAVNTGSIELVQVYTAPFGVIKASPTAQNMFTLPAGSKILAFNVEVITGLTTATNCGITIGKSGTANYFVTTFNTGATAVRVPQATIDAATQVAVADNIGTADLTITGTFTAATADATVGSINVIVRYIQRLSDATIRPTGVIV